MEFDFVNQSEVSIPKKFLTQWIQFVSKYLVKTDPKYSLRLSGHLTIVFLDPTSAKKLNKQYRNKNYAADVLSFSYDDPGTLGELVLCPQILKKQAQENEHSFRHECAYMVLHGILHLLGFEHEGSKAKAKIMFELQDEIFSKVKKVTK